jgi:hypothetical protein
MHFTRVNRDPDDVRRYAIHVAGQLDSSWADALGNLSLAWDDDNNTVLTGELLDQSALHGVLARLLDLGLPLIGVALLESPAAASEIVTRPASHRCAAQG